MRYSPHLVFLVILAATIGITLGVLLLDGPAQLRTDLRALPALGLGALFLVSAEWLPIPGKPGVFIVGSALMVVGLIRNRHLRGVGIMAFGLFLTGFVVLINGYLPLRSEAASSTDTTASGLRQDEADTTTLGILGDVVPLGPWVLSFGDLIATAGAFIVGRNLVRVRTSGRVGTQRAASNASTVDATVAPVQRSGELSGAGEATPIVVDDHDSRSAPLAISADEFLARYLELDDAATDRDESPPSRNPVIDLREMPEAPRTNPDDRFIRVQSADDLQP